MVFGFWRAAKLRKIKELSTSLLGSIELDKMVVKTTDPVVLLAIAQHSKGLDTVLNCVKKVPPNANRDEVVADFLCAYDNTFLANSLNGRNQIRDLLRTLTPAPLGQVALRAVMSEIRAEAIELVTDQSILCDRCLHDAYSVVRSRAAEKVQDTEVLAVFAERYPRDVSYQLIDRLNDMKVLRTLAGNSAVDWERRVIACRKVGHDPDGNNRCQCSVCGFKEGSQRFNGLGLHDFNDGMCTRCGARVESADVQISGWEDETATTVAHPVSYTARVMTIRYRDGGVLELRS